MKQKKVLSVLLTMVMISGILGGCGNKPKTDEGAVSGSDSESKTVTMMGWYNEDDMESVLNEINRQLDGKYEMEYTYVANTEINNVLSTQLAAGEGPDIIMDGANYPAQIKAGNVEEISDKEYVKEFNEAGMALCTAEGKIYGIPSYGWFSGIWCNEDILEECGITTPKTFDEFIAACEKINNQGYTAYGFGLADDSTVYSSLMGYMQNSFYTNNPANSEGTDFDAEFAMGEKTLSGNYNESVNKWYELIEKNLIAPESLGISCQEMLNSFKNGEVAFLHGGPWQYTEIKEAGVNFLMLPQLSENGENPYVLGGPAACFGINVNTKNHDGAEAVLEALATVEVQTAFAAANVGGTSYRAGVETEIPEEYDPVREILNKGNIAFPSDRWSVNMPAQSLIDEFAAQLQGIISGDVTVEDMLKNLDTKADSIRYE